MNYRQLLTRMIYWRIVRSWEHISACPGWMSADHWRRSDCHSRTKRQRIPPREKRPALASLHCSLARKENCFSSHLTMFSVTLSAACNQKPNFDNRLKNWDQDNKNYSFHFVLPDNSFCLLAIFGTARPKWWCWQKCEDWIWTSRKFCFGVLHVTCLIFFIWI